MRYEKVLLDFEAQRDLFSPAGSCYTPPASAAAANVRRLFTWARRRGIPVISTMLRVRPGRIGPLAPVPHCVDGTNGEKRIRGALLRSRIDLGLRDITDLPEDIFASYDQVLFEKRVTDIFRHGRAERLLTELDVGTFVVCGAGSAHGIVEAVVGLAMRGIKAILASDAILDLDDPGAEFAWLRMLAKGATPATTDEIVSAARPAARARQQAGSPRRFRCGDRALTG